MHTYISLSLCIYPPPAFCAQACRVHLKFCDLGPLEANLGPTWSQVGAKLDPSWGSWAQLGARKSISTAFCRFFGNKT